MFKSRELIAFCLVKDASHGCSRSLLIQFDGTRGTTIVPMCDMRSHLPSLIDAYNSNTNQRFHGAKADT